MMDSKRDWFQILTNLGVVLGIAVLVYQVNQANTHTIAQLADANFQMGHATTLTVLGESSAQVVAKAYDDPSTLTLEERVVLDAYHQALFMELEHRNLMAQLGIFKDDWTISASSFATYLAYPAGRIWWSRKRNAVYHSELRSLIDKAAQGSSNKEKRIQPYNESH